MSLKTWKREFYPVPIDDARRGREAPHAPRRRYDHKQIAKELLATARGEVYHGNALYVAKDIPILTDEERWVVYRWLDGFQVENDKRELELIAIHMLADA